MKYQCELPDLRQSYDSSERGAIRQLRDRSRHDWVVVAENPDLDRTPLSVRIRRAERDERAHRTFRCVSRVTSRHGAAEAVADQMNAVAARFFFCDAPQLRGGIIDRLPSPVPEIRHVAE